MSGTLKFLPFCKILFLLIAHVMLIALTACQESAPRDRGKAVAEPVKVNVVEVWPRKWAATISSFGRFEAASKAMVGFDFSGVVRAVEFEQGQYVNAGATLVKLDDRKQRLLMQQALAQLSSAKAALEQKQVSYRRYQALEHKHAISRNQLEVAQTEFETAAGEYSVAVAKEALARHKFEQTTVTSPVEGVVVKRAVEVGQTVESGAQLAEVQVVDRLRFVTYVTEQEVNLLRIGAPQLISSSATPGRSYKGYLSMISASADPDTGNFLIKVALRNTDGLLKEGMSARVELRGLQHPSVLLIPRAALVDRGQRRVVYKAVQDQAIEVEPVLGVSDGPWIPVTDGLAPGDRLIVDGLELIINGVAVSIGNAREAGQG